jgi:uncharacterized repeat protein (TIGR03837 family)
MHAPTPVPRTWDLFCRVIDNLGDTGVCWRLCADLAERGETVRLWIDDASALAWMAPQGAPRVTVHDWHAPGAPNEPGEPGDVVIEAFGCELPVAFIARMAARVRPPLWVNLEYLSAEAVVERNHRLRSPQSHGPGAGLTKWFFYPGFTERTGGLTRERGLMDMRAAFDATLWLGGRGIVKRPGECVVSLFCYARAALPALIERLAAQPTLLLCAAGAATEQVTSLLGPSLRRGSLRAVAMPWLTQPEYDRMLWASDLNFVRGEDSFVRAQWAGAPFVWQAYPQDDGVHHDKIDAFLARHLQAMPASLAGHVSALWAAWNRQSADLPAEWPAVDAWARECRAWRDTLLAQADLAQQLIGLARETG